MNTLFNCCLNHDSLNENNNADIYNQDTAIPFTFPVEYAKCVNVYDGDTITILFKLTCDTTKNATVYRHTVRIAGIDCPEKRTKNLNEKEVAIIAKNRVEELLLNKIVKLENVKNEIWGRILADVKINNNSIANILLMERLAVAYDGKTKIVPENWLEYYHKGDYNKFITTIVKKNVVTSDVLPIDE